MKHLYSLIFISSLVLVVFSSCVAGGSVSNVEKKILGTWDFEEVKFRPDADLFYSDYSDDFQGSTVTFKEAGILEAYDKNLDTTASGFWYIDYYEEVDEEDGSTTTVYYMVGTLNIPELNISTDLLWDKLSVWKSKLTAIEVDKNSGDYKYRLVR